MVHSLCQHPKYGSGTLGLAGGLQISLDMEKAFEIINRQLVVRALDLFNLDPDLLHLIHTWLFPHKYLIPYKQLINIVIARRDIK